MSRQYQSEMKLSYNRGNPQVIVPLLTMLWGANRSVLVSGAVSDGCSMGLTEMGGETTDKHCVRVEDTIDNAPL